ncbi:hypothetical protein FHY55_18405 [Oceanicola sp. D3]|uniref:hypothetical protein n=1 Tax=Oceanicola sp. D3 TaxID=2587163 RepID=UPI001123D6B1|nr:hypothetical protein [Oceanicola sp. D3]QDC11084.1 hypothetical protein FHY55_18405 [Oceanicola sp. D3]
MQRALCLIFALLAAPSARAEGPPPVVVEYGYDNGSLPPPYREEFRAEIRADGTAVLTACRGYDPEGCVQREARVRRSKLRAIRRVAERSGLAQRPAALNPEPPIGGGLRWGKLVWSKQEVTLPALPAKADAARVKAVLDAIHAALPKAALAEVNAAADRLAEGE